MNKSLKKQDNIEKKIIESINFFLKKYKKKFSKKNINTKLLNNILDSLDFVNFIIKIEKDFKVKIPVHLIDTDLTFNKIKILLKKLK